MSERASAILSSKLTEKFSHPAGMSRYTRKPDLWPFSPYVDSMILAPAVLKKLTRSVSRGVFCFEQYANYRGVFKTQILAGVSYN